MTERESLCDARSLMVLGLRSLLSRLDGMLAGTEPWHEPTVETATMIVAWWEVRRAS